MVTCLALIFSLPLFALVLILNLTRDHLVPSALALVPPITSPAKCQAILELSDLPPRFEPAPSFLQTFIVEGIAAVNPQLEQEGIALAQTATFVDFGRAEIALGLTATLPKRQGRNRLDEILNSAEVQDIFVLGLQQSLAPVGMVKVNQVREITIWKEIGEVARGFAIEAEFEKLPLKLWTSAILFRRGDYAALVILGSFEEELSDLSLLNLASKLDQRLRRDC